MSKNGIVNIKGKDYKTVAYRVNEFWKEHEEWSMITDIIDNNDNAILMKCTVIDDQNKIRGTGFAEEIKGSSNINKTSAIENCETSAIGRALSCIGLSGGEYASANEVTEAILEQERMSARKDLIDYNNCTRENIGSICDIKDGILEGKHSTAAEAWFELDNETKSALWKAPSKGGIFTTQELEVMKSKEFRESYTGIQND